MSELPGNFVVVDIETTDLDPERGSILEIGAVTTSGRVFYRRVPAKRKHNLL